MWSLLLDVKFFTTHTCRELNATWLQNSKAYKNVLALQKVCRFSHTWLSLTRWNAIHIVKYTKINVEAEYKSKIWGLRGSTWWPMSAEETP